MKFKNILFSLMIGIILIASAGFASASYDYTTRWYYNGNPVMNVRAINYVCSDSGCNNLGAETFDAYSGAASNAITVPYTVPAPTYGYATYWLAPGYRMMEMAWRPTTNGYYVQDSNFLKYPDCHADIASIGAPASINEGQQIIIVANINSALQEDQTHLPYGEPSDADIIQDYLSARTNVTLTIKDSLNNSAYTETKESFIREDMQANIAFAWTPSYSQAGNYAISISTDVTDSKCSSTSARTSAPVALAVLDSSANATASGFSNLIVSPASPAIYAPAQTYRFNVTINSSSIDSAWLEFNGTNYPATKNGDVYSVVLNDLKAGNYSYRWLANNTQGALNQTDFFVYVLNRATPNLAISFIPGNSVQNGTQTNASGINCPLQLTCTLFRNNANVSNPDIATLGAGTYTYKYNSTENENYTSASVSSTLIIWVSGKEDEDDDDEDLITIDDDEFRNGDYATMNIGDKLKFVFCGAPYYIKLTDIDIDNEDEDDSEALFKVIPGLTEFSLEEDEKEEIDLNGDGIKDVLFRVESISEEKAKVYIKRISDKCAAEEKKEETIIYTEEAEELTPPEKPSVFGFIILMLMLGILLAALAILFKFLGMKKAQKKS